MGESEMKMDEPSVQVEAKKPAVKPAATEPIVDEQQLQDEDEEQLGDVVINGDGDGDANDEELLLNADDADDEPEHAEVLIDTSEVIEADAEVEAEAEDDVELAIPEEHDKAEDTGDTEQEANENDCSTVGNSKTHEVPHAESGSTDPDKHADEFESAEAADDVDIDADPELDAEADAEENLSQENAPELDEKYDAEEDGDDVDNTRDTEAVTSSILEGALKNGPAENPVTLNKMHMEDVREGCDTAQPSSPGHADLRSELTRDAESLCDQTQESTYSAANSIKIEGDSDEEKSAKRKSQDDDDVDEPAKKLKKEIQQESYLRNKILMEYTESLDMANMDQIQIEEDKLIVEVQNLDEIAKEKERQWNNIIHVKKMKEELLMRVQRQKKVYLMSNGLETSDGEASNHQDATMNGQRAGGLGKQDAQNLTKALEMNGHDPSKPQFPKGAVRNVQSIIADFRQRHPETVPRRGRRIRNVNGNSSDSTGSGGGRAAFTSSGGTLTLANVAQVRPVDANSEIALLLSSMENGTHSDGAQSEYHESTAYKEFIEQLTHNVSERKKTQPVPPLTSQYPEVTVHAVTSSSTAIAPTNSLLHGILTKAQVKADSRTTFSPTLARLLTAPDKAHGAHPAKSSNVSISDILSTNKARSEITITPVASDYEEGRGKRKQNVEEETEDSVDRLVIDESTDLSEARTDNNSDAGDEVPQCQGCNQKAAQFVCAGCGNQWYCSRECQVTAWDEHSDVCSG